MSNTKGIPGKTLVADEAPDGPIDAVTTTFRQSPSGTRSITLDGSQAAPNGETRGVQIDFPSTATVGEHDVPQGFPNTYAVKYFRQVGAARTSFPAKNGKLNLDTLDLNNERASGSFDVTVSVDGSDQALKGHFDIASNI